MAPPRVRYSLEPETGTFVVDGYNWAKPFSNFLPGIAGKWGIPLWLYYVSRGQAVSSFGVRDKDGQILEFHSFNTACARIAREGFRTFLRVDGGDVYEPFQKTARAGIAQSLRMTAEDIVLVERNRPLGLEIEVTYYPLPQLRVAALTRRVVFRNLTKTRKRVEVLDGLPRILPRGLDYAKSKTIARHIEAMMGVVDADGAAVYRLKQAADDTEQVAAVSGGTFFVAPRAKLGDGVVVDPETVFGAPMDYGEPWVFADGGIDAVLAAPEMRENKTPCAFVARAETLPPESEREIVGVFGSARRDEDVVELGRSLRRRAFLDQKREENRSVIREIADHAFCVSSSPQFDAYAKTDFLDNVVRGGMPLVFDTARGKSAFYVYSRQNGDLERDYHFFVIDPTYLSQGTGHYRSILQNRRTDTWFFPEVEGLNLKIFLNLIQLDGYNPLEVLGTTYRIENETEVRGWLAKAVSSPRARRSLLDWMKDSFTPGELAMRLEEAGAAKPRGGWEKRISAVLRHCRENENGGLHEGFWADHWHYNFDLLDVFEMVYPDRVADLLFGEAAYTYFDDPDVVLPRHERSVDVGKKIRSYGAVVRDAAKSKRIAARERDPYTARDRRGNGNVYQTTLLVKLLTIVVNRLATLDPGGTGVEMEAGKPGWNDSMNGLPGLFGSGLSEALELRRAIGFLSTAIERSRRSDDEVVLVYRELAWFLRGLREAIGQRAAAKGKRADFLYWDAANDLKEVYREATKFGVSGKETRISVGELRSFLEEAGRLLDASVEGSRRRRVVSKKGVPYTYFVNEVRRSKRTGKQSHLGHPTVRPTAFEQKPVKLFLEGPVHWMKVRPQEAREVYESVRASPLFDRKLEMYRACENMTRESPELGRAVGAYPRGWIENESIYLHMEYKYLLEILRSGLCEEFWRDAKTTLAPFLDPSVYGRSTLEGASFIVSSAYADPRLHGQAFQPRLSGITCEFLHLWTIAVAGERPFSLDESGRLQLTLRPRLPGWLFTKQPVVRRYFDPKNGWQDVRIPAGAFAFKLMNRTLVVYRNERRRSTWTRSFQIARHRLRYYDGTVATARGPAVAEQHALAVRSGLVQRIDVTCGA